ncbi:hypothetical protein PQR62_18850 [Herbaspirillum lusitanum]|uniref:4,5-dihydroxyphthalate decarboxylase n=1 Tax=Herbaspirillum lusitanum TaxID=213312 RepID=A0ABW9AFZ2_9BURK
MSNPIIVCGGDYEHVLDFSAAAGSDPASIAYLKSGLAELSRTVLNGDRFDVAEYSLANYIMLKDRGDHRLAAIPVFPSRAFRNASVFVANDSPLKDVASLKGKKIGISDFAMTTAVWTRGHLSDDFGLDCRELEWVIGANPRFPPPAGVRVEQSKENLEQLLLEGKIDALMAGKPKEFALPPGERRIRFLLEETEAIERTYYETTGFFPIMHTIVLHASMMREPEAARCVFDAYVATKKKAIKRRLGASYLPFAERAWERYNGPGMADPYQHGLSERNRRIIMTLARYLLEQGMIQVLPDIDQLFVPGSMDWRDE